MAINVQYQPSFVDGGELARDAGRGRFLQDQAKFDYQRIDTDRQFALREDQFGESQRQFDETIDQRGSQFDRNLGYQVDSRTIQDRQVQQRLNQQEYQFDRQQGQQDRQFAAGQEANERRAVERQQALESAQQFSSIEAENASIRGIRQRQEDRQYSLALQDFSRIEDANAKGKLKPAEYDQAKRQFVAKHGRVPAIGGEYPGTMEAQIGSPQFSNDMMKGFFAEAALTESLVPFLTEVVDGEVRFLPGAQTQALDWWTESERRKDVLAVESNKAAAIVEKERLKKEAEDKKEVDAVGTAEAKERKAVDTATDTRFSKIRDASIDGSAEYRKDLADWFKNNDPETPGGDFNDDANAKPKPSYYTGIFIPSRMSDLDNMKAGTVFYYQGEVRRQGVWGGLRASVLVKFPGESQ